MKRYPSVFTSSILVLGLALSALEATPEPNAADLVSDILAEQSVVGLWSGKNVDGIIVSYLFEADGTAVIYENAQPVLGEAEQGATLRWSFESRKGRGTLDLRYSDDRGTEVKVLYVARFSKNGRLVLRSGGQSGARPADTVESDDRMQIRLTREY